jgi:hypothetical protein
LSRFAIFWALPIEILFRGFGANESLPAEIAAEGAINYLLVSDFLIATTRQLFHRSELHGFLIARESW